MTDDAPAKLISDLKIDTDARSTLPYDQWVQGLGLPLHTGYFIEDCRTIETAPWDFLGCNSAFIQLAGMEGIVDARVTEIAPGGTVAPYRFALDEAVYVVDGQGMTTIWADGVGKKTFEWGPRSLFLIPRGSIRQFSNARGDKPARLISNTHLPVGMSLVPDPSYFFNNDYQDTQLLETSEDELYSVAKRAPGGRGASWHGNFFTDLAAWNGLVPHRQRGGGGHVVDIRFPHSEMGGHMSVFPPGTYKKAHRHGPGVFIMIPAGEGYSIMWPEGEEKVIVPWHEASMFVPPNNWFHQHFNVSVEPARYLALSPIKQMRAERNNRLLDQIEYPVEEPWVRKMYEEEIGKRGLESLMPEEVYQDPHYKWTYDENEEQGAVLDASAGRGL
tara:strand:+ start:1430 stop:2590 length:1161 start_codon:yes stop_codon:yes gene_type:complete